MGKQINGMPPDLNSTTSEHIIHISPFVEDLQTSYLVWRLWIYSYKWKCNKMVIISLSKQYFVSIDYYFVNQNIGTLSRIPDLRVVCALLTNYLAQLGEKPLYRKYCGIETLKRNHVSTTPFVYIESQRVVLLN